MHHAFKNLDTSNESDSAPAVSFPSSTSKTPLAKQPVHHDSCKYISSQLLLTLNIPVSHQVEPVQDCWSISPSLDGIVSPCKFSNYCRVIDAVQAKQCCFTASCKWGSFSTNELHDFSIRSYAFNSSFLIDIDRHLVKERKQDAQHDQLKNREREWNRPQHSLTHSTSNLSLHASHERTRTVSHPTRPESSHALTADRLELHRRSLSRNSMRPDSPGSSMASSFELDKERHQEEHHEVEHVQERNWDLPHPTHSPTPSASSEHARRPSLGGSAGVPERRRSRYNSLSSSTSSRASSPALSASSKGSEHDEVVQEIFHERERNWNAAHPQWNKRHSLGTTRPVSPSPSSPSSSVHGSPQHTRDRAQSLRSQGGSPPIPLPRPAFGRNSMSTSHSSLHVRATPSPKSKLPGPKPVPPSTSPAHLPPQSASPAQSSPGPGSNFGWKFPKPRSPLPPLELEHDRSPVPVPKASSHIPLPVRHSPSAEVVKKSAPDEEQKKKSHRRSITEFNDPNGPIPPKIHVANFVFPNDPKSAAADDAILSGCLCVFCYRMVLIFFCFS